MAITVQALPGISDLADADEIIVNDVSDGNATSKANLEALRNYLQNTLTFPETSTSLIPGTAIDIVDEVISVDPTEFADGQIPNSKVAGQPGTVNTNVDLTEPQDVRFWWGSETDYQALLVGNNVDPNTEYNRRAG